jgi:hypothetical protein
MTDETAFSRTTYHGSTHRKTQGMDANQLIAHLNAIKIGDLDAIRGKLQLASRACLGIEQPDLAGKLDEALEALDRLDLKTYRRRVEAVVSKLGHIR